MTPWGCSDQLLKVSGTFCKGFIFQEWRNKKFCIVNFTISVFKHRNSLVDTLNYTLDQ